MAKEKLVFDDFLADISPLDMEFVQNLHEYLLSRGCSVKVDMAKNGFMISYSDPKTKKSLLNYVQRKAGLIMRIYGANVGSYDEILEDIPSAMREGIEKAGICKRLYDPTKCNSRCTMGYIFNMGGQKYQKCKNSSFMFPTSDENKPFIEKFVKTELEYRAS